MADDRMGPAPRANGAEGKGNNAGERPRNHTSSLVPGSCLIRYEPPEGRAVSIRLSPTESEMLAALRQAPSSRFDLAKRRPRLGLSGPQIVERLRKAGVAVESEWVRGPDCDGRPVRFVRYCLRGRVLSAD